MNRPHDDINREVQALQERDSALSAAILRISASLDLATVLQEVVDSARALTGARYGVITTIDEPSEFVTSGFTDPERAQLLQWAEGPPLFAHLRDLPGAVRITDLPAYVRSLGYRYPSPFQRYQTFQGTPIRYRGTHAGHFFLAEKEGGAAFSVDDEEVLVLFATQAATAIANARTHRDEQRARADLEDLERLRTQFLGMVSHELRAPLTSIKGSAAAALGTLPALPRAEMLQFFRIIDAQADHMQGLIGDLLDAGRIEAGTLSVDPEPSDVTALVDRARNIFASGGARHTIEFDLPELPRVMADRERIVQVLNNLLSNAARHAPESSPIRVEAAREEAHVAISVCDRGRGVPPEMLGQLFRKHVALAGGHAEGGIESTGLGLAICKGLVEAHGGRIRAESAGPGRGARFTFTLPVAQGEDGGREARSAAGLPRRRGAAGGKPRILVVDDDPKALRFMRGALIGTGYTPVVTGDPDELADLIRTEKPGLVLLDLVLPETDGIKLIAQAPELSDLPVIFISAYGRDETIALAFESGAEDYIVKPFSPTELIARVGAALRRRAGSAPFVLGDLAIEYERRRVTVGGRTVPLTATEYELLRILSVNAGRVVSAESLLRQAWDERDPADTDPVRAFIRKLRTKLGDDAAHPTYIFNVRGVGYRMPDPGEV